MSRSTAAISLVLLLAASAGPGCRSFQGNLLRREVAQAPPKPEQPDPAELARRVALEHDRRAGLVEALKVTDLKIQVDTFTDQNGRSRSMFVGGTAEGVLVMERPRNLRILLKKPLGMSVADIGSNDREFWFANDLAHEMIIGSYAQAEGLADPFLASVRPGWIFEVLGLEPIAADASIERGESDATLTIVEDRTLPNGVKMVKESVLNVAEQRIVEHRLYSEGRKELVAQARVEQPVSLPVGPSDGVNPPETIQIPRFVRLTIPEVAELRMTLVGIEPNPSDDFAALTSFEKPPKDGYQFVDLFDLASQPGPVLADASSASSASTPPPIPPPSMAMDAPGALVLPRSDREVARVEDASGTPRRDEPGGGPSDPVALDLPSASRVPGASLRRETWDTIEGNRFRRGVLRRE
ncbi:hypothetical protein [Tautonia plasticadhaerens]|uniref:Outer membrane lipoprotein-sorting protein n=1 Tax=Tautonia plasticadhaerens TaxID=2527974 RepID=A0A518H5C8_9BACT|nr:hypothetical protein [Tautonia plasticadhaerens]QDV36032.1 hypothetical protein ElP_39420 [Tautonia plasticadhaerens]